MRGRAWVLPTRANAAARVCSLLRYTVRLSVYGFLFHEDVITIFNPLLKVLNLIF